MFYSAITAVKQKPLESYTKDVKKLSKINKNLYQCAAVQHATSCKICSIHNTLYMELWLRHPRSGLFKR